MVIKMSCDWHWIISLNFNKILSDRCCHYHHFTEEDTEALQTRQGSFTQGHLASAWSDQAVQL